MKLTIIKDDSLVQVDGDNRNFSFTIDSNIHAIQWYGTEGNIEYNDGSPNLDITDISDYQYLVTAHAAEIVRADQEEIDRLANRTYDELRVAEGYDPIPEQLDMIYHDLVDGSTTWKDHIKTVKDTYPKP